MEYILEAQPRERGNPRELRRKGLIPGVVYGPGVNVPVVFRQKDLEELLHKITRSSRIKLNLNGQTLDTFIKEIQYDALTDRVIHIDLYKPPAAKPIKLRVPLVIRGEAKGRHAGGVLQQIRDVIEIKGLPERIPEKIELNVTELDIGEAIHVKALKLEGVEVLTPPDSPLVTVAAPRKEEEVAPAVGAAVPGAEAAPGEAVPAAEGAPAAAPEAGAAKAAGEAKPEAKAKEAKPQEAAKPKEAKPTKETKKK